MAARAPQRGYYRLSQIIGSRNGDSATLPLIPVSYSTWYAGIKTGRFPAPTRAFGGRISVYRADDIHALIEKLASEPDDTKVADPLHNRGPPSDLRAEGFAFHSRSFSSARPISIIAREGATNLNIERKPNKYNE